ncbi:hypothetical protein LTR99_000626 [Exophiala xenobiotica]|uniref:Septin-type G domain-containing protein n=1 Tax=Vermiconidia calcicola TaxID=1690605 RepID=A0AAV9QGQ8_9PEZI|nr:hypothetical protein LTR92_002957 [Exophiala xenobiotica]KAK5543551.1 hypothetical protein LTR25_001165 [Vermiconidia calcicola]KAK5548214.1 hypothetical protein LTR23_001923 [Chaetothyriales sp. CCFEE 6169]KAK5231067.1 hypothetical protein LTR72_000247 [Exophiala xenobiotica]KAK5261541.1 hypothetical protein LTR40_002062 [Exophiala xenobiotica]
MRPALGLENAEPRPRKSSVADPSPLAGERCTGPPTTFFLSRDPDAPTPRSETTPATASAALPVSSLQDAMQEAERSGKSSAARPPEARSGSRRRSTIRPAPSERLRRGSSIAHAEPSHARHARGVTPSPLPSCDVSLPSSPKSSSSRSLPRSDDDLTSEEAGSQAIGSSEEDEEETPAVVQDSQPELIMPSIKMPSRRPFTERGKRLGRFKIMVAGRKGAGKTSLIKSIVQLCEDIVHVDPVPLATNRASSGSSHGSMEVVNEVYASTKPYPAWWSNVEESRILRRRKSMGDSVLERNICFVDTNDSAKLENIIYYAEQQLINVMTSVNQLANELSALLSGRGSSQVDVILYLISKDHIQDDCDRIRQLSELCNIIPLVAKSDLLTMQEQEQIKQSTDLSLVSLPRLPTSLLSDPESKHKATATAPYTVTSINGPDLDTMDASLLMSPEYIQPLLPSELSLLVDQIFEPETVAYLRHTSARKLVAWHADHPRLTSILSPSLPSAHNSTLASPLTTSLSNSGVLIPLGSEVSLNISNSWALAKVADHTQREERLAQVRLSKWASELQLSLQRERERYERLARGERAVWLVDRLGEEVREGHILPLDNSQALVHKRGESSVSYGEFPSYQMHDPLGLLRWQDSMRTRGWIALQIMGSFGVVGGIAFWVVKSWGLTATINEWAQCWHMSLFGHD